MIPHIHLHIHLHTYIHTSIYTMTDLHLYCQCEENIKDLYTKTTQEASVCISSGRNCGINLLYTEDTIIPAKAIGFKIDFKISCEPSNENQGYMIVPRSSTGAKTPIRLSNSIGIIDPDYRGHLMVCVDNLSDSPWSITTGTSNFQIISPHLSTNVVLEFIDTKNKKLTETDRATGGFGSTGNYGNEKEHDIICFTHGG